MSLSAVPLVVVIVVLWRLGRENTREIGRPPNPAVMADEVPLESDTFWCIDPSVVRLRACHVMAWTAGLAALTLAAPLSYRASTAGLITCWPPMAPSWRSQCWPRRGTGRRRAAARAQTG